MNLDAIRGNSFFVKDFKHDFIQIPPITSEDTPNGRFYKAPDTGALYPSVTTMLDAGADKEFLVKWRERVGEEEANRISLRATDRGTALHLACEALVLNQPEPEKLAGQYRAMFQQTKSILTSRVSLIYGTEVGLWSHKLGVGGRTDLLCKYEGEDAVLDYKNLSSYRKSDWVVDYFLQGTCYSLMLQERTGRVFKRIVILAAIEGSAYPQVFSAQREEYMPLLAERIKLYRSTVK